MSGDKQPEVEDQFLLDNDNAEDIGIDHQAIDKILTGKESVIHLQSTNRLSKAGVDAAIAGAGSDSEQSLPVDQSLRADFYQNSAAREVALADPFQSLERSSKSDSSRDIHMPDITLGYRGRSPTEPAELAIGRHGAISSTNVSGAQHSHRKMDIDSSPSRVSGQASRGRGSLDELAIQPGNQSKTPTLTTRPNPLFCKSAHDQVPGALQQEQKVPAEENREEVLIHEVRQRAREDPQQQLGAWTRESFDLFGEWRPATS